MKIVSYLLFVLSFVLIMVGVYFDFIDPNLELKDKFYGFGSLFLFFIAMPVFLYTRRNSESWEKYKWNQKEYEKQRKSNKDI